MAKERKAKTVKEMRERIKENNTETYEGNPVLAHLDEEDMAQYNCMKKLVRSLKKERLKLTAIKDKIQKAESDIETAKDEFFEAMASKYDYESSYVTIFPEKKILVDRENDPARILHGILKAIMPEGKV